MTKNIDFFNNQNADAGIIFLSLDKMKVAQKMILCVFSLQKKFLDGEMIFLKFWIDAVSQLCFNFYFSELSSSKNKFSIFKTLPPKLKNFLFFICRGVYARILKIFSFSLEIAGLKQFVKLRIAGSYVNFQHSRRRKKLFSSYPTGEEFKNEN
jgi:hypothetical protein